jgi:hypothetical protein
VYSVRGDGSRSKVQVLYAVNIYLGRKQNDAIALAWAAQFCDDGEVLDRNFSLLGTGNNSGEVGACVRLMWASGRGST